MPKVTLDSALVELRDARDTAKDLARIGDWSRLDDVSKVELCDELNAEDDFHGVDPYANWDTEMEQDRLDAMGPEPEGSCYEEDEYRGMDHDPLDDMGPWPQDDHIDALCDFVLASATVDKVT